MARVGARKFPDFFHSFPIVSLWLFLSAALVSCDPDSSGGKATPPRFTLTQNDDGTTFTLTIGEGVKTIAEGEFAAVANINTGTKKIDLNSKLAGKLGAKPEKAVTTIVLPSTLESISDYAFYSHHGVKGRLVIPKQVRTIGINSFADLSRSSSVTLEFEEPSQLTAIGKSAFSFSRTNNVVKLPESLETIGGGAFYEATFSVTNTFRIPAKVKRISPTAFFSFSTHQIRGTLTIASPHLTKPNLGRQLFCLSSDRSSFTTIKLHQAVYDSYTKAELSAIFGTGTIAYQKLNGDPHTPKP